MIPCALTFHLFLCTINMLFDIKNIAYNGFCDQLLIYSIYPLCWGNKWWCGCHAHQHSHRQNCDFKTEVCTEPPFLCAVTPLSVVIGVKPGTKHYVTYHTWIRAYLIEMWGHYGAQHHQSQENSSNDILVQIIIFCVLH